jgi:hypothetical protein
VEWVLLFAVLHEAEVRQGAVSLALGVCGRLGQVMVLRQKWGLGWGEGRGVSIVFNRESGVVVV